MSYETAEQTEEPAKGEHQYVSPELPQFKKKDHPLSLLAGDVVFTQDERARIGAFKFSDQQASPVLAAEVETCRSNHEGHVLRQQISVERCSIFEYRYLHAGKNHTIYVNSQHNLVEDIAGPIQTTIEHLDANATTAFREKRYEDAYRLNLRSLCMDEATSAEKKLREDIFSALTWAYFKAAFVGWFLAAVTWLCIILNSPVVPAETHSDVAALAQFNFGIFLGLIPIVWAMLGGVFSRDIGLRLNKRERSLSALLFGICALLSGVAINRDSQWVDWIVFAITNLGLLALTVSRSDEDKKIREIEKHKKKFANTQALETYVCGLDYSARYSSRVIAWLVVVLVVLLGTSIGPVAYRAVELKAWEEAAERENQRLAAEAKAKAEAEERERQRLAAEAKAKAEAEERERQRLAAEANAKAEAEGRERQRLAEALTKKLLDWTGGALRRAGMKEDTIKRALTQGGTVVAWGWNNDGQTSVLAGLSGVVAIAAGGYHTVALKLNGTVRAWGYEASGQTTVPAGLSGVVAIAAGEWHTVALKYDGTVVAWGKNISGQATVPAGLSGVVAISAGSSHTVALKSDGTVVAWGGNDRGQTTVPAGLSGVVAIAAGGGHTVALKSDGTVVAWGGNDRGQATVPAGLSGVVAIAAGDGHTVALKSDGTVVAEGKNISGQATVPAGLSGVVAIAAGGLHTVALKSDGTVVAWGGSSATVMPAGLSGVVAIAAGANHTVALKLD